MAWLELFQETNQVFFDIFLMMCVLSIGNTILLIIREFFSYLSKKHHSDPLSILRRTNVFHICLTVCFTDFTDSQELQVQ